MNIYPYTFIVLVLHLGLWLVCVCVCVCVFGLRKGFNVFCMQMFSLSSIISWEEVFLLHWIFWPHWKSQLAILVASLVWKKSWFSIFPLACELWKLKVLVLSVTMQLHELYPARLFYLWNSPGKNTRVDTHSLLQVIFLTQGKDLYLILQAYSFPSEPPGKS